MRFRRTSPWILLPAIVVLSAYSSYGRQGITLRHELKEGATQTYHATFKSAQSVETPNGPMDISATGSSDSTQTVGKVEPGGQAAEVSIKTTNIKIDSNSPMAGMMGELPKEVTTTATIDTRNRITNVKFDEATQKLMTRTMSSTGAFGSTIEFPEGPVNIGDAWESTFLGTPLTKETKLNVKLIGDRTVDGTPCWLLSVGGKVPVDVDLGKLIGNDSSNPMAGQQMNMKGTIDMANEVLVDKASNSVFSSTGKGTISITMDMPAMGIQSHITGKSEMAITRTK